MTRLERASFEVDRFELGHNCLEVHGRWFGIRGRRFMRPTLTGVAGGRTRHVLAALDHKPWVAEEGEAWLAAFPWSSDAEALLEAELTVAPDVTVPLPPPSSSPRARRSRARSRSAATDPEGTGRAGASTTRSAGDGGAERRADESRLLAERESAVRAREEALTDLDAARHDREQLRHELRNALAAREADIAERHQVIEAEVGLRIADLRAEAERERAAAGLAAQTARERDEARAERIEATRERDQANAERDLARRDRNEMLAQRDTARTRAQETSKRWELAAALGTRRTHERDAAGGERDRMAVERDAALETCDRTARQRDAALEVCDRTARERDAALEMRDRAIRERDTALEAHDRTIRAHEAARRERRQAVPEQDPTPAELDVTQTHRELPRAQSSLAGGASERPTERAPAAPATSSVVRLPRRPARPSRPIPPRGGTTDRPLPPSPATASRSAANTERLNQSLSSAQTLIGRDTTGMWRTRLLGIAALLIALVFLIVLLALR